MPDTFILKNPSEVLKHSIDWSGDLASGETVSSSTFSVLPTGELTLASAANTTTATSITLSAGTAGKTYLVKNTAITSTGETLVKQIEVIVQAG